jgi:iodotyrosine deiodinase
VYLYIYYAYCISSNILLLVFFQKEFEADFDPTDDTLTPILEEGEHIPYKGITKSLSGGADAFYEIANDRRSVRMFSKKPVDFEIIKKCIQCAGTGPSGAHTEPWTFCVVEDMEMKKQIREIIEEEEYANYKHRMSRQWTVDLTPLKTGYIKEYLTDAPYLILVFKQTYGKYGCCISCFCFGISSIGWLEKGPYYYFY